MDNRNFNNRNRPVPARNQGARVQNTRPPVRNSGGNTVSVNKNYIIAGIVFLLVIANIVVFSIFTQSSIPEKFTPSQIEDMSAITLEELNLFPFDTVNVTSKDYTNGILALVSNSNDFLFDYTGVDIKDDEIVRVNSLIENKTFKTSDNTIMLARETVDALNDLFADFYAQTGNTDVMIHSAYRTEEEQTSIYESYKKKYGEDQQIANIPGKSEHHTGYAFDIMIYPAGGKGAGTFTGQGIYGRIYDICHKYGFILRYPEGKTEITGVAPESWHFRYVGIPHATYMYQRGITLEEYLREIKSYTENVPLSVETDDGTIYEVYYVNKGDGLVTEFNVPKDTEYFISGDNVSGFVVWYEKAE